MKNNNKLLFCLVYLLSFFPNLVNAQCPTGVSLELASLEGIPNFPQVDELNLCSVADTASILIANTGEFAVSNLLFQVSFDDGLTYGDFVFADPFSPTMGGVSIFNIDDPSKPVFRIDEIAAGASFILDFGIRANCQVDLDQMTDINFDVVVDYNYSGGTETCQKVMTEVGSYNSGIREPVLNILSVSPQEVVLAASASPVCQQVVISQDGIDAYLEGFQFLIQGLDQSNYTISSLSINGTTVPDTDYAYDAAAQEVSVYISGDFFIANYHTAANGDNLFDSDERLTVEICYEVAGCTDDTAFLMYQAFYGCSGLVCGDVTEMEGAISFAPDYAATPIATSSLIQYGGICGDNLSYAMEVQSANTSPVDGLWQDLIFKYKGCIINNTNIVNLNINGVAVPTALWSAENGVVTIDLTSNTTDFDGAGGLSDADNDGFFDDLPGGQSVTIFTELEIGCALEGAGCSPLACSLSQLEINGKRNCGQNFQNFATLGGDGPVSFFYGEESQSNNNTTITGHTTPITEIFVTTANVWNPFVEGYNFTYDFGSENIAACASGTGALYARAVIFANGNRINHLRYEEGSATYQGAAVSGVTWEYDVIEISPGVMDTISISIQIPAGDVANDPTGHDYYFNLEAEGDCFPDDYMTVSFQVVEECNACGTTAPCEIIRTCNNAATFVEWNGVSCVCDIEAFIAIQERTNYGYTDKSMTTKVDPATIPEIDKRRYLPGDTMYVRHGFRINNAEQVIKGDGIWQFNIGIDRSLTSPVVQDAQHRTFKGWFLEKAGTGIVTEIGIPSCLQNPDYDDSGIRAGTRYPSMALNNFGVEGTCSFSADNFGACPTNPRINPDYPVESVVDYGITPISINTYVADYARFVIYWGQDPDCTSATDVGKNDCYEAFLEEFPIEDGDIIYVDYEAPMMHNPNYDLEKLNDTGYNSQGFISGAMLVNSHESDCSIPQKTISCGVGTPYYGHIPGPVAITTNVEVTDCDIQVSYDFTLTNPVPTVTTGETIWFENEYRPAVAVEYLEPQFPSNLVYLGEGTIRMLDGTVVPIPTNNIDDSEANLTCINSPAGLCCVAEDNTELMSLRINDNDYFTLKELPYEQGPDGPYESGEDCDDYNYWHKPNDPFPMFNVGGTNDCNWGVNFSLSALCPEDIESTDFRLKYQFADRYLTDLFAMRNPDSKCPNDVGSYTSYNAGAPGVAYGAGHLTLFPENPYGEGSTALTPGWLWFHFNKIVTHPDASPEAVNPMRQTGELITTPDNFIDNSMDFPALIPTLTNLLLADAAGANEMNTYEICAGTTGGVATHTNVVTSIEVPNAVEFIDAQTTAGVSLTWTLASTTDSTKVYAVVNNDLAPGACETVVIVTELIFCPIGLDANTEICVSTVSGCVDPGKAAALSAAGGACDVVNSCYEYIAEEADIQVEWDPNPMGEYSLCEVIPLGVRIKNVKPATLVDIKQDFWFPTGLDFVSGSFQVCYPGGPTNTGACVTIPDPIADPTKDNIFGRNYTYQDDAVWSSYISSNGLVGILSTLDSNRIQILFDVETTCDAFVSGTSPYYQASAADPCESTVTSMFVESDPIIIQNANPANFAQFFVFADPTQANCGEEATLSLTYVNVSPIGASQQSKACISLETDVFDYTPGSVQWVSPASHTPTITEEANGPITKICFDIPDGIAQGDFFNISLDYSIPDDISCGPQVLGVTVDSEIVDQACIGEGVDCSVYVLNSVNPTVEIEFLPPLNVEDQSLVAKCPNGDGTIDICYDIDLVNPGEAYSGDVTISLFRDLNLDSLRTDVDELLNSENHAVTLANGEMTTIQACFTIAEGAACPVFLNVSQQSTCSCSELDYFYGSIEPEVLDADLGDEFSLCPNTSFGIPYCSAWTITTEPEDGATIEVSPTFDSVFVSLNTGFGVDAPVILNISSETGGCSAYQKSISLNSLEDFTFGPFTNKQVCAPSCTPLSLGISNDFAANVTVVWSPADFLDDNTLLTPTICNPTSDITYSVNLTYSTPSGTCNYTADYPVKVLTEQTLDVLTVTGVCADGFFLLEAPTGYSS